ncbi:MAG: MarR family transcriptional regulator [Leptospiraceae bacterium]|nr:MarR family transcriptional regulator [Leptospiraceae bacterium]
MILSDNELKEIFRLSRDLSRVSRLFQQENIHCGGLTFQQFTILDFVRENGKGLELSKLHDLLAVEKSTTTRLIQPLIKKKFLQKKASPSDPRAFQLFITRAGEGAYGFYWDCLAKNIQNIGERVPRRKLEEIKSSLRLYVSAIGGLCGDRCCL